MSSHILKHHSHRGSSPPPPPPLPILELLESGHKEQWLVERVRSPELLSEHKHSASPWSVSNVFLYLDVQRPHDGFSPLHVAAEKDFGRLIRAIVESGPPSLLERADCFGRTPLLLAASASQVNAVQELIALGASLCARDTSGKTALHHAVQLTPRADVIVTKLLEADASVDALDEAGYTPLSYAVGLQAQSLIEIFLKSGANPISMDQDGRTLLEFAGASRKSGLKTSMRCQGTAGLVLKPEYSYPRWDHLGSNEVQQSVLLEERIARRRAAGFGKAESNRLRAAKPQIS
eukprot:TRINITY_DN34174_c0_g1_i1.p1 TRINITY_DN34174_c0_g1~~TRINITY_DN34174_c0_g1_i1.p1  ORF type:complete len:291 (-),score=48.03 TRINITY_DN34174_c0_g1_i1:38-910(-)